MKFNDFYAPAGYLSSARSEISGIFWRATSMRTISPSLFADSFLNSDFQSQ
jgi:hypothetical protein